MKKYKVVVVGMGKRGMHHAAAFRANSRFEVVGICDIDESRLAKAAAVLGNPMKGADAAALVRSVHPDVFCFCTLPDIRAEMIRIGIAGGAKLIAMEKPIALSSGEAMQIKKLLDDSGAKAVVSHQHRYGEHYQKVREIVASGELGRLHTICGTATGWMMHMCSHLIDYIRWYNNGEDARWVMGQASGRGKFADRHSSPDYIAGFIQFANGVRGIVECGAGAPDIPEVDAWWRKARISAYGTEGYAEVLTGGGWRAVTRNGAISGGGSMDYDHDMPPYVSEIADWLDDESKVHSCSFESAYKGFEIMMALCRSVVEGGQVELPLACGMDELKAMQARMPEKKVLFSLAANAKEYDGCMTALPRA